ncbi:hypothetical protein PBRA_000670 [Plasmodiophora brassicae]|uniref:Mediator complex subunit Med12 domain-containing protein n=1 Tax=Plasmodiophora brassicae TaxID=37360 RepID=A0A0G4IQ41_PLABS|nr:hypothetical protein PBRA_000670 [Plasmodiophora brassicae]
MATDGGIGMASRPRTAKQHSTASAWTVKQKSAKRYRLEEHELFKLPDGEQVYADVYRVIGGAGGGHGSAEERLSVETFTHGFKPDVSSIGFEHNRLNLEQFRAKRHDLRRRINELRSRSRKKRYADNPIPLVVNLSPEEKSLFCNRLADVHTPLADLAQSPPFGYKADVLLDMLWSKRVSPQRATWFIKVVYLNMFSDKSKARPGRRPAAERKSKCKEEWTEHLQAYLAKTVQSETYGATNTELMPKWSYLCSLLCWQYELGLLSRVKLLYWLIGQLEECSQNEANLLMSTFWLLPVARFIHDIQLSRLHSYRLFCVCSFLVGKTSIGRVTNHEGKSRICCVAEAIITYLEDAIPMSRNWTSMRDMPSNESRLARRQTEASSLNEFNVPHFILLLDSINECSSTCPGVITCSKILLPAADVLNGSALTTLLRWSVDEHRQHLWIRSLVAGYLIKELHEGASTQTKAALVDHIVEFACEFRTADKHVANQLIVVYTELSRAGIYSCALALRYLVSRGILGNASLFADPIARSHGRFIIEHIPLFDTDLPRYVFVQRRHYLYGLSSNFDDLLRGRLLAAFVSYFNDISGGAFYRSLSESNPEAYQVAVSRENHTYADDYTVSWDGLVDRARPGRTAVETIAVTAPLFHVEPVLQTCTVALIRMFQSEGSHTVLALQSCFHAAVNLLFLTSQFRSMCTFLVTVLETAPMLERTALVTIRAQQPVFFSLSMEATLRSACSALMRRDMRTVQSAEIWLANARLSTSITRWLSENVVQKFTGRYHNPVGAAEPIDPNKRQGKLQSLFNAVAQVGFDRAQSEMLESVLAEVATNSQSIMAVVKHTMNNAFTFSTARDPAIGDDELADGTSKHVLVLQQISSANDKLGDNRVPLHDVVLSHYVGRLMDAEASEVDQFLPFGLALIVEGLLQLDIVAERVIVRPLRVAGANKAHSKGAQVACALASFLYGRSAHAQGYVARLLFRLHRDLVGESVTRHFPVLTSLAEVALDNEIYELTPLALGALRSVLGSRRFCQFSMSSLSDVYMQLISLRSARQIYMQIYTSGQADDAKWTSPITAETLIEDVTLWNMHLKWIDIQLALAQEKRVNPGSSAESELAQLLLQKTDRTSCALPPDLCVQFIKLLASSIGKHILAGVQSALKSHNQVFIDRLREIGFSRTELVQDTKLREANADPNWRVASETVVQSLSSVLPAAECVPLISSIADQLVNLSEIVNVSSSLDCPLIADEIRVHILKRVRCLRSMTPMIQLKPEESRFPALVRALLSLMCSSVLVQSLAGEFDECLCLFEQLIDGLRFGTNSPADGSPAQRKDDEFIISLDREVAAVLIPVHFRRRIQRTLPTFSGAIVDGRAGVVPGTFPSVMSVSTPSSATPTIFSGGPPPASPTNVLTPTTNQPAVGRLVSSDELQSVDPWTILQGVPGTPLVQRLLETSAIVARDGSSIDSEVAES